ncbi:MAG: DEAD/DEAH box helicase [Deltaproteobacteria bacterium]|nr:MAG: DEAD/DEAH box helicase [Deltaproteobacteria bacterium]
MELQLTPLGHLVSVWEEHDEGNEVLDSLHQSFEADWREGLFRLGAEKVKDGHSSTLRYWRSFAEAYLTSLCHQVDEQEEWDVEDISPAELLSFYFSAPPMMGGEYLTEKVLHQIWEALDDWTYQAVSEEESLSSFLGEWAPLWNQVGRVCFHLAENKKNPDLPFAFLATYSTGLGASGQVKHLPMGRALKEYSGKQNKARLINLLTPVLKASETCPWVKELIDSGGLYKPMAWPPENAYEFLLSVPELEQSGLTVRLPDWWKKRPRPKVSVTIGEKKQSSLGAEAVLDFDVSVALGAQVLSREELEELLNGEDGLVYFKGQWVEVDHDKLQEAIEHWDAVREDAADGEISFIEGMRLLAGASSDLQSDEFDEDEKPWAHVQAGSAMQELLDQLRSPEQIKSLRKIKGLNATLRPYQEKGVAWLALLTELGLGACLADDMGLGKTIQVLSLLLHFQQKRKKFPPSLLVVPASLLGNWKNEAEKFAPSLQLLMLHTSEIPRATLDAIGEEPDSYLDNIDLVVTTYSMLYRQEWLATHPWHLVILDEAQAIKNPGTRQTRSAKKLLASSRIALTGTPVENRLGDLWSLFDFINPGLLGSSKVFKKFIKDLQERERDQFAPLRQLVSPYILRRMKTDPTIISDLPDKTEMTRYCELTKQQVKLYKGVVDAMAEALSAEDPPEGIQRKGLVLQSLMRLKQICNHPSQVSGDGEFDPKHSGKFAQLAEICEELASRQEKVLIFTQFREIIDALEEYLAEIFSRPGLVLHGGTSVKKRKGLVKDFQAEDGPPFFILSLKAGGTGLNLTAANHVIHFDRWWNPAVENQATDRAFRIGQKRNVLVHKFVTSGTIEERIDALIREKQELADEILSGEQEVNVTELSNEDLLDLVRLDVTRATF